MLKQPLTSYASVAAWGKGLEQQWGGDPFAEDPAKLESLAAFCEAVGKDPDALVAFCFLRKRATGERFTSQKRRETLLEDLKRFESSGGATGVEARRRRSHVVSFLSHNGVLIY